MMTRSITSHRPLDLFQAWLCHDQAEVRGCSGACTLKIQKYLQNEVLGIQQPAIGLSNPKALEYEVLGLVDVQGFQLSTNP